VSEPPPSSADHLVSTCLYSRSGATGKCAGVDICMAIVAGLPRCSCRVSEGGTLAPDAGSFRSDVRLC